MSNLTVSQILSPVSPSATKRPAPVRPASAVVRQASTTERRLVQASRDQRTGRKTMAQFSSQPARERVMVSAGRKAVANSKRAKARELLAAYEAAKGDKPLRSALLRKMNFGRRLGYPGYAEFVLARVRREAGY